MEVQGETHEEIGPSWEEFFSEADKMADEKNKITTSLTMMKGSNHLRNVSLLPYKSNYFGIIMHVFFIKIRITPIFIT